ncbi:tRNA uridine-5-carboxymethylaminomethyl(34) synthesis GTPase MnmE [Aureitalea marina]|uniref:tRNA modification GTPase MnmE n=1 Tax=Aureitalea marina TaxID=930804 RepID=A0A2S7KNP7_9FLAO|nr:tRNA uridine-5-carboxymethylaminomethyl(34) synthesis GTPase MnmE [Aureitalea marina]PQB04254.1 tRNA uridine-5-carboxymethylaminomethyl(34) synthesis GTPase MnmE [Aureitalea marina]
MNPQQTIVALATPPGTGAIAVIRMSGPEAIAIIGQVFQSRSGKKIEHEDSHTVHLGWLVDGANKLDEVLVSVFKNPSSYTGEDVVEISCHGSPFIQQLIIKLLLHKGCRMATAGEFTLRAFLNGKMDLSQAEAVADLITSDSAASHQLAMRQMRGGFSSEIHELRAELLNFASLIELELDFAEEDVEFANRSEFTQLLLRIDKALSRLIESFSSGNVLKNGIPVAIVGEPNVGKSTLLNALLNEDRAIVSDIAGTTRDTIEDEINLGGVRFRFIDTAGIRKTSDTIESLGIEKTFEKMQQARIVLLMLEAKKCLDTDWMQEQIEQISSKYPSKPLIVLINKVDTISELERKEISTRTTSFSQRPNQQIIMLSAKDKSGMEQLTDQLLGWIDQGVLQNDQVVVTNSRHYDALTKARQEIIRVQEGMEEGLSSDLLAIDIRQALHYLGEITGEITTDDLLGNIFANFCIGK